MTKLETIANIIKEQGLPFLQVSETEIATSIFAGFYNYEKWVNKNGEAGSPFRSVGDIEEDSGIIDEVVYDSFLPLHIYSTIEDGKECIWFTVIIDEETPEELY